MRGTGSGRTAAEPRSPMRRAQHDRVVGDPALGGRLDFQGMMAAYTTHFGPKEQPNKPARSTMQVAALAAPGALVEIEVIAARP